MRVLGQYLDYCLTVWSADYLIRQKIVRSTKLNWNSVANGKSGEADGWDSYHRRNCYCEWISEINVRNVGVFLLFVEIGDVSLKMLVDQNKTICRKLKIPNAKQNPIEIGSKGHVAQLTQCFHGSYTTSNMSCLCSNNINIPMTGQKHSIAYLRPIGPELHKSIGLYWQTTPRCEHFLEKLFTFDEDQLGKTLKHSRNL